MAYQFIVDEDFDSYIQSQLLRDPKAQNLDAILEDLELKAIALVRSKLNGRFDLDAIFAAIELERHHLIVDIICTIIIYKFVRRNAARKVPSDFKDEYDRVMKMLMKIEAGKLVPEGLPKITDDNGDEVAKPIIANRKNNDFYI
ncbi:phage protein Gp36 family protein [Flagellimonas eckloniae]|uniref:DUF1320 domain-containing protein n=1 Tax=Flagellimonas eckloniae TaxID=346185 RepID=A0A0N8WG09_9FLAO|nr:phage protein Gp36 family protein [Allomuricauda eckloniae]KQC30187.1 hypothetical protein AAY42_10095 [Allomuricauda eckloniae]